MSEYDPSALAQQSLYGSERDGYGGGGSGAGRAGQYGGQQRQYGGGGGGGGRHRGPRRSGGGGGGYRGDGNGRGYQQQQQPQMSSEEWHRRRLRDTLFRIGDGKRDDGRGGMTGSDDFHPPSELFRVKEFIEQEAAYGPAALEAISAAFRVMATEQPHKTSLTAALIGFLFLSPRESSDARTEEHPQNGERSHAESSVNVGRHLVHDLIATLRSDLDSRYWRNVRLLLHLFASLLPLGFISASSLRAVLASFAAVLDEPGVAAARGDRAALCVAETMFRAGRDLVSVEEDITLATQQLDELVEKITKYAKEYRQTEVELVRPVALRDPQATGSEEEWMQEQSFDTMVQAVHAFRERGYARPAFIPSPLDLLPPPVVATAKEQSADSRISLPYILVPPDDEFVDGSGPALNMVDGGARTHQSRGKRQAKADDEAVYRARAGFDRVSRYPKWFKDTVPSPTTPEAVVLRSLMDDIMDLYQVNRKEAARLLFELPRWLRKGTFISKSISPEAGIFGEAQDNWQVLDDGQLVGGWALEEMIVECIISSALLLPTPPQKPIYYMSVLREIVTFSPQSVAPAMGKTVRRVYGVLGAGRVDAEAIRRFAEWFSAHLSNFNFTWGWKEWIPDMDLPKAHPKLAFARRIVELEIRLAYYERIKTTLVPEVQVRLLPEDEPGPSFTYGNDQHPYRERAAEYVQSMRARATAEVILANLQAFKKEITPELSTSFLPSSDDNDAGMTKVRDEAEADLVIRDVVIQSLLSIGSRSFSHFLNVVERYHTLLRQLSSTPLTRIAILASTARFWVKSPQWIMMIFDKWLQYRIVEPTDVIDYVFRPTKRHPALTLGVDTSTTEDVAAERDWSNFNWWEIIKLTVLKVQGRVDQVRKRLEILEREDTEQQERLEAVREAGGAIEDPSQNGDKEQPKMPLFPSGATQSTLPRRSDLPPSAPEVQPQAGAPEKKQTVQEVRASYDTIVQEQRKVLVSVLHGFVGLLRSHNQSTGIWKRSGQDSNDEETWQVWWIKSWYVEYCRLFAKDLSANYETMAANVFGDASARHGDAAFDVFDRCSQMATE